MKPSTIALILLLCLHLLRQTALAHAKEYEGAPISTTVYVSFAEGSARFRPNADNAANLASASGAALVSIRGRTSTSAPTAKDEVLALARAIACHQTAQEPNTIRSAHVALGMSAISL